jgi:hypothetical protein
MRIDGDCGVFMATDAGQLRSHGVIAHGAEPHGNVALVLGHLKQPDSDRLGEGVIVTEMIFVLDAVADF